MNTTLFVPLALILWPVLTFAAFSFTRPRKALLLSFIGGWLFLPLIPLGKYDPPLLHNKMAFLTFCVGTVSLVMDGARWQRLRFHWFDWPLAVFCLEPAISSLANGLGAYDAGSAILALSLATGVPYVLGRIYFDEPKTIRELAIGIIVGGLVYIPFCLFEIRFSPQLHSRLYGTVPFQQFAQTLRFGGYRPQVFMHHGLMVGLWMAAATLVCFWAWRSRFVSNLFGIPTAWLFAALFVTTILCKSLGAIVLLLAGMVVIPMCRRFKTVIPLVLLLASPPAYEVARSMGWSGQVLVQLADRFSNQDRAGSLKFRLDNEDLLMTKAYERPIFGWGRWGGSRVKDESGQDISITDGFWIIVLGFQGIVGLAAFVALMSLPGILFFRLYPAALWSNKFIAPAASLALIITMYAIDNLFNAMENPIFPLCMGALTGLYHRMRREMRAARAIAYRNPPLVPRHP